MTKQDSQIDFDIKISMKSEVVYCMYLQRASHELANITFSIGEWLHMKVNEAHNRLGHCDKDPTCKMAKHVGIEIVHGNMKPCEPCTVAKARQQYVPKQSDHQQATDNNTQRIFIDISTVQENPGELTLSKPHWCIMVDERTNYKLSRFYEKKLLWWNLHVNYFMNGSKTT